MNIWSLTFYFNNIIIIEKVGNEINAKFTNVSNSTSSLYSIIAIAYIP